MPKYNGLRKTGRDRDIRRFAKRHPTWSHQEIAYKFGIARSNISRILAKQGSPTEFDS